MTMKGRISVITMLLAVGFSVSTAQARPADDSTTRPRGSMEPAPMEPPSTSLWGMDILISNDGFGLGVFHRREFSPDLSGFASFSISESKDEREVDRVDPYTGVSFVPGKLKRFLVLPLMVGVQYRLFREDIVETFRPYVNAGVGPAMIYVMPFIELSRSATGTLETRQVEFFSAIGKGQPRYTAGGFIGFGANFGTGKSGTFGVNFRYYFMYLFSESIPSLYDIGTGNVIATKSSFGGFFITLNIGLGG